MSFSTVRLQSMVKEIYGLEAAIRKLPGEVDLNFYLETENKEAYVLKIAHANENRDHLELQNAVLAHLTVAGTGLQLPHVVNSQLQEDIAVVYDDNKNPRMARLLTWVEGRVLAEVNPHTPALLEDLGKLCGKLCKALSDFDHPHAHRFYKWDPSQVEWIEPHINSVFSAGAQHAIVQHFYTLFKASKRLLPALRKSVNYNDANDYNVLVGGDVFNPAVTGVIDFGDTVYTAMVNELAVSLAYAMMNKPDPLAAAFPVVRGFHSVYPLKEVEIEALFPLIAARLLISVTCAAINQLKNPENGYLQVSVQPAWTLLSKLKAVSPSFACYTFRSACGLQAHPKHDHFKDWALHNFHNIIFPVEAELKNIPWLDLSVGSAAFGNHENITDAGKLNAQIQRMLDEADATVALGCYNEARPFYTTAEYAMQGNDGPEWRTVHLGIDVFASPGTIVRAPLDGIVHSFADNNAERDYGPTVILEHSISADLTFYTLYGHLSRNALTSLSTGKIIRKGDVLGTIGDRAVNGNWPPHLHFQIMLDTLGNKGDFSGVAQAQQRSLWTSICPDPMLLFTGRLSAHKAPLSKDEIVHFRKAHLGKNMSISYRQPLQMVRGIQQYLLDESGRRYLDTVNNVAHVGHEHPRVVKAGQRQMAVLNTNTRYLHENLVRITEAVLATMPAELTVAYVVNSGSEANELAMRLAKTYTSQKDMIVVEVGYHGNTNACVEISSYKFDGPGGTGSAPHVHVVPIPDTYRGIYCSEDQQAGQKYATHVYQTIQNIKNAGRNVAAFIGESVLSCGGQVVLPEHYLKDVYRYVREAGGVCIADEVQTGCGRAGDHFWAFEAQGVVPDIVTIGKPIGNGHPLGVVVTTQAVADAFKNGMEYFNTFGGNPVSCAIGLEVLSVIKDEGLQQHAREIGAYLTQNLLELKSLHDIIGDVRGPGLFLGVELVKDRITKEPATRQASYIANRMKELGILMSTDGPFDNVLKVKPPIIFNRSDADFLIGTLDKVLKEDSIRSFYHRSIQQATTGCL